MVAGCFRLSDWGPAMEHDEPGQVGNQAALSRSFYVSDSIPADDFLCVLHAISVFTVVVPKKHFQAVSRDREITDTYLRSIGVPKFTSLEISISSRKYVVLSVDFAGLVKPNQRNERQSA